jgi:hypothetical protein
MGQTVKNTGMSQFWECTVSENLQSGDLVKLLQAFKGVPVGDVGEVKQVEGFEAEVVFEFKSGRKLTLPVKTNILKKVERED